MKRLSKSEIKKISSLSGEELKNELKRQYQENKKRIASMSSDEVNKCHGELCEAFKTLRLKLV